MYSLYPNIVPKIKEKIKDLNLTLLTDEPEKLIQQKKRFFRAFCLRKDGKRAFFKSLLAEEKGIKDRFLNEVGFAKTLGENKNHPLYNFTAKTLGFSLNPAFLYILQECLPGNARESEDRFSQNETKKIALILKTIINSPVDAFKFTPKKPFFDFSIYKKSVGQFLKNIPLDRKIKTKIQDFIGQNKGLFNFVKPALSHGDFSEANLIFYKNTVKIVNWEHVHLRNPAYDFTEFWLKRREEPKEQKILKEGFLKYFKNKKYFSELFKMALIEICLRDLSLFWRVVKESKKSGGKEKVKSYLSQFQGRLEILNKNLK